MNGFHAIPTVTLQEARQALQHDPEACFLDVRPRPDNTQIQGARHVDPALLMAGEPLDLSIGRDARIIVYCDDPKALMSRQVASRLIEGGWTRVAVLEGGYRAWRRRQLGYPIERRGGKPPPGNPLLRLGQV